MKVVKYYCDICKKEVENESSFIKIPYPDKTWNICSDKKEICIDCMLKIANFIDKNTVDDKVNINE